MNIDPERLRALSDLASYGPVGRMQVHFALAEAADEIERLRALLTEARDVTYSAGAVIFSAHGGDWSQATDEWRQAAERWRDEKFHPFLGAALGGGAPCATCDGKGVIRICTCSVPCDCDDEYDCTSCGGSGVAS